MSSIMDALGDIARQTGNAFSQALKSTPDQEKPPTPNINVNVQPRQPDGVVALVCPNCNASIQSGGGGNSQHGFTFCPYCGAQLLVNDGSTTVTYKTVDETRIRELELEAERERLKAGRERFEAELEEKHRPGKIKLSIVLAIIGCAMILIGWIGDTVNDGSGSWMLLAIMGFLPFVVIMYLWLVPFLESSNDENNKHQDK